MLSRSRWTLTNGEEGVLEETAMRKIRKTYVIAGTVPVKRRASDVNSGASRKEHRPASYSLSDGELQATHGPLVATYRRVSQAHREAHQIQRSSKDGEGREYLNTTRKQEDVQKSR